MEYLVLLLTLAGIFSDASCGYYGGYELVTVLASSSKELEFLHKLQEKHVALDFWSAPAVGRIGTMLLSPELLPVVKAELTENMIFWYEREEDVTKIIQGGMRQSQLLRSAVRRSIIDHNNYHDYRKIKSYLRRVTKKYPQNAEFSYLKHRTHERRSVAMIKLSGAGSCNKPAILMESGIHAREWISPASTLYFIEELLRRYYEYDVAAMYMLDVFDWYIVPVTNPDGYQFTHRSIETRLWRKNRKRINSSYCIGVDLNRNFDAQFGTTGVSFDCRSNIYPGPRRFSEPESQNIRELYGTISSRIVAYLAVHSYSQFLLLPWSWSLKGEVPENSKELYRVAHKMAEAIKGTNGKQFSVGTAFELLNYAASGTSSDWALYAKPGLYPLGYELRPRYSDVAGFNLPPDQIIASGEEFYASLEVLAKEMKWTHLMIING